MLMILMAIGIGCGLGLGGRRPGDDPGPDGADGLLIDSDSFLFIDGSGHYLKID